MSWPHAAWRVLLLATVISSAVSCEAERRVILTCPSPDGTNKAVFWVLLTPSAAGTAYFCLNVAASTRSTSSMISDDKDREESQVMVMQDGGVVRLTWLSSKRLQVEYPEDATLRYASSGAPFSATGVPDLRVVYRGSDTIPDGSDSTCERP